MEFTWLKTCAARKYTFFRAHFWSPGTAYLKYTCPHVYFWCFDVVYFLHMFGAFAMRFLLKSVFFYAFGTCVSPRRIFFTPWAPASCAGVFILRVWKSDLHVYCECIFLPAHCAFFLESAFLDCTCGNKNHIFAASVFWQHMFFLRSSVLDCFKIVRVSTGFGDFNCIQYAWFYSDFQSGSWFTSQYCRFLHLFSISKHLAFPLVNR